MTSFTLYIISLCVVLVYTTSLFILAQYKKDQVAITAAAAPGANATSTKQPEDVEQTAKQKEVSDFEIAARKKLGLKIA